MIEYEVLKDRDRHPYIGMIREHADVQYANPCDIAKLMQDLYKINEKATEYVHLICFDTAMHIIGIQEISHGAVNASLFPIREIMIGALLCGATNIILTHNHPSGVSKPSREDISATEKIKEAAKILGLTLRDHIITGNNEYFSFNEEGMV